jgi:hypothetical protein
MLKHLLPLIPAGLLVRQILPAPDGLVIVTASRDRAAACPDCGFLSAVVHSRYERRLQDLPWQGHPVTLRIQALLRDIQDENGPAIRMRDAAVVP